MNDLGNGKPSGQPSIVPSAEAGQAQGQVAGQAPQPEMVDFTSLGEHFKDFKVPKSMAEKIPSLLKSKHFTPELLDALSDGERASLFYTSDSGYRASENKRLETATAKIKAAEEREMKAKEREEGLLQREKELLTVEGDAFFKRNPKVKEKMEYAQAKVASGAWEEKDAEEFVEPFITQAKEEYKAQEKGIKERTDRMIAENSRLGKKYFPEFEPDIAECLPDGLVLKGRNAEESIKQLRENFDRVIALERQKAVIEFKTKGLDQQPPSVDTSQQQVPIPVAQTGTSAMVELGRNIGKAMGMG